MCAYIPHLYNKICHSMVSIENALSIYFSIPSPFDWKMCHYLVNLEIYYCMYLVKGQTDEKLNFDG